MISFESLTLEDFALYPHLSLQFSTNADIPLTLIRGENESGKTTLMRAFLWVLYGENALPSVSGVRHPIRPVWAETGAEALTRAELRFRSDTERGSSFYKLTRSAVTSGDDSQIICDRETVSLLRRDGNEWEQQPQHKIDLLFHQYFRPEMQDLYFIDADKAVEYVGGPEGRHSADMMRATTTGAVRGLLSLDVMLRTINRLGDLKTKWNRNAGRASTNPGDKALGDQLEEASAALDALKIDVANKRDIEDRTEAEWIRARDEIEQDLQELADLEGVNQRIDELDGKIGDLRDVRQGLVFELANQLNNPKLYGALMMPAIEDVVASLRPMKESGHIPPSELSLLPRILDDGRCVCGIDLESNADRRAHIEGVLERAQSSQEGAELLDHVLTTGQTLGNSALGIGGSSWIAETRRTMEQIAELEPQLNDMAVERELAATEREERSGTAGYLHEKRKHRDALHDEYVAAKQARERVEQAMSDAESDTRSLGEQIRVATKREQRAQEALSASQAATDLQTILETSYASIERDQVEDVSKTMNGVFRDMISATDDSLFEEVGIRSAGTKHHTTQYEPYAKQGSEDKPMALVNGASRRAIAVSFVLALVEETGTRVPFVADSLLHAMSGSVRRKVVGYLTDGKRVGQPILFVTRDDVASEQVWPDLLSRTGESYTLTSQAHAGGDVVRATPSFGPHQVAVCRCNVREFCDTCERLGDRDREGPNALLGPVPCEIVS